MVTGRLRLSLAVLLVGAAVLAAVVIVRSVTPRGAAGPPTFVDETAASGVAQRYDGPDLFQVGGGVAVFDCNGDGLPDLYLAGGQGPASLYLNDSTIGGALRFQRVASPVTDLANVNGAYPIDIDGDGNVDLVVLRVGENEVLRGRGDCTFEPANEALSFAGTDGHTTAFSATWEGDAQLPTLAIGHYLALDAQGQRTLTCDDGDLLRPAPGGSAYAPPLELAPGYCALSMLFSDWDGSGRRDLRVTNDRQWYTDGLDQLWRISPGEAPRLYTAADGWVALHIWGMGIASQDLTGDGLPEIFLTSQGDNKLQTLANGAGQPTYLDIALKRGVTSAQPFDGGQHLPSTAWHPEFADVNNDGLMDLFVSKGNVGDQAGYATRDPSDLFLGQPDGTFVQAADKAGILRFERGRGAALVDLNLDGMLDLVEVNYGADTVIWRNVGTGTGTNPVAMGHWLSLELQEPGPNRDGVGASIVVRAGDLTIRHEVTIGGGHIGGQLGWMHVGIGTAILATVQVTWPDGVVGPALQLEADTFAVIDREQTAPVIWTPGGS
jgi:enediyne biosynthesis protein E4